MAEEYWHQPADQAGGGVANEVCERHRHTFGIVVPTGAAWTSNTVALFHQLLRR